MAGPTLGERTRAQADPIRNFKFLMEFHHSDPTINSQLGAMGFTSIDGLSMTTDVTPYREGGWNTNPHKLPGQSDFAPLTCTSGVFVTKPGMWNAAKQMFAVQWGQGNLDMGAEFRFDAVIKVLDHPVTKGQNSGSNPTNRAAGTVLAFKIYNAWVASVQFGGLNAGDNSVLVHNMTMHHEGLETMFGNEARLA